MKVMEIYALFFVFLIPNAIILCIFFLTAIAIKGIKKHNIVMTVPAIMMCAFVCICVLQSDFIKSRKIIDRDWLLGKSIDQIECRYTSDGEWNPAEVICINEKQYIFCARETIAWNLFDGVRAEKLFYVYLNDESRVEDVYQTSFGGEVPLSEYDYWDRW